MASNEIILVGRDAPMSNPTTNFFVCHQRFCPIARAANGSPAFVVGCYESGFRVGIFPFFRGIVEGLWLSIDNGGSGLV